MEGIRAGADIGAKYPQPQPTKASLKVTNSDPYAKRSSQAKALPSTVDAAPAKGIFAKAVDRIKSGAPTTVLPSEPSPSRDTVIKNRFKPTSQKEAIGVDSFRDEAIKNREFIMAQQAERERESQALFAKTFAQVQTNKKRVVSSPQQQAAAQAIEQSKNIQGNLNPVPSSHVAKANRPPSGRAANRKFSTAIRFRSYATSAASTSDASATPSLSPSELNLHLRKLAWQRLRDHKRFSDVALEAAAGVPRPEMESAARQAVLNAGASEATADEVAAEVRKQYLTRVAFEHATTSLEHSSAQAAGRAVHASRWAQSRSRSGRYHGRPRRRFAKGQVSTQHNRSNPCRSGPRRYRTSAERASRHHSTRTRSPHPFSTTDDSVRKSKVPGNEFSAGESGNGIGTRLTSCLITANGLGERSRRPRPTNYPGAV